LNLQSALDQFKQLWTRMPRWQRISIPLAALSVAAGLIVFSQWRRDRDFKPLFTGMGSEDAGAVVAKLKESGVEYRVSDDGKAVLVPSAKVAETRLQLASAGLPRTGRLGFELFDQTKLGSTDFAEQVNYRRALEGELERSIRSVAEVEQARVHLTFPKDSVFLEAKQPAKASVLLHLRDGVRPAPATVTAISHLVASAVEGLTPEAVSVMDAQGALLSKPKKTLADGEVSDEAIEYRRKLEKDLLAKADATLEPLLGAGRYRIGLSVDCDFASGEQSEELYDPEKSVMLTSQKTEETGGSGWSGGVPGTASNLPRPVPRQNGSGASVTKRTENISYQSSRTVRKLRLPQGNIRRISASVLLDQTVRWEMQNGQQQRVLVPPTPESVRAIRELVSGAIGFVPSRGDQLVVESLPFDATLRTAPPPLPVKQQPSGPPGRQQEIKWEMLKDWRILAGAGVAFLLIVAGLVLVWRKRKQKGRAAAAAQAAVTAATNRDVQAIAGAESEPALTAGESTTRLLSEAQERVASTDSIASMVARLRNNIAEDPALAANVLRTWLEERE
jgi:flagellar M-ring protein FliF